MHGVPPPLASPYYPLLRRAGVWIPMYWRIVWTERNRWGERRTGSKRGTKREGESERVVSPHIFIYRNAAFLCTSCFTLLCSFHGFHFIGATVVFSNFSWRSKLKQFLFCNHVSVSNPIVKNTIKRDNENFCPDKITGMNIETFLQLF